MRKHARYFYVLFFIIILTFIFWGVGTLDKPQSVSVAEIGKEKVSVEDYWRVFEQRRREAKEQSGEAFDEAMEKKLKETVLNDYINEKVLLVAAEGMGVSVTDKELQEAIMNNPQFLRNGVFSREVYFRSLDLQRMRPEAFETSIRQVLTLQKMGRLIGSAVEVNPLDRGSVAGDEATINEAMKTVLDMKRDAAVKSFVNAVRQRMEIKVNKDVLS
jgi:peptidyl-prolyl cis-trans isomerase D